MELVVVGGVDDRDDLRRRDGPHEPGEETGGTDTTGERREHGPRLPDVGRSEPRTSQPLGRLARRRVDA